MVHELQGLSAKYIPWEKGDLFSTGTCAITYQAYFSVQIPVHV